MTDKVSFLDRVIAAYEADDNADAYSDARWPHAISAAKRVASLLEIAPPARILDLACGSGASTSAMALMGFDVTGIDCTPGRIAAARRLSRERGASVEWLCDDIRQLASEGEFDAVCLRDVIFGVFEPQKEDRDLVRRMATALRPGGRALFEVYNVVFALAHGVEGRLFFDESIGRFVPAEDQGGAFRCGCTAGRSGAKCSPERGYSL